MAAPISNSYWQNRKKHGRNRAFTTGDELETAWIEFFQWCNDNPWYRNEAIKSGESAGQIIPIPTQRPYTEAGFQAYHSLGERYIQQLTKSLEGKEDDDSKDISSVLTWARNVCLSNKLEGAIVGAFNANIIARIDGYVEKTSIELSSVKIENATPDNSKLLEDTIRQLNEIDNEGNGEASEQKQLNE